MLMRDIAKERAAIEATIGEMTIVDVMERNAAKAGDRAAIQWMEGAELRTLSWSAYRDRAREVAAGLQSLGVASGDFVALMAANRPEHVIGDVGALYAGAVPVSVYNTLATPQVQFVASNCGVKVAIVENLEFMKRWEAAKPEIATLDHIVLMEGAENYETTDWVLSWDDLVARGAAALAESDEAVEKASTGVVQSDLATLLYTSGTTGTPKGVMISHRNVLWTAECTVRTIPDLPDHPRFVSYLPLAHIGERMATHYIGLWQAGTVTYIPDLADVAEGVKRARPQVFFAVPRVWEKFQAGLMTRLESEPNDRRRSLALGAVELAIEAVKTEQAGGRVGLADKAKLAIFDRLVFAKIREGLGLDDLTVAISAAAPISPELLVFFRAIGLPVYELFGMTESTGPGVTNRPGANRIGTVGQSMPGVEIATADDDEILIRGGLVTEGYYENPTATAETYDEEGWLHTGDLGRIDQDGYLTIIGRKKEIIINAAGKNIAPAKLENLVKQHPLIAQACVVGEGRKYITLVLALDADTAPVFADKHGLESSTLEEISREPAVLEAVDHVVSGANEQVARVEQAKKWFLASDAWTPESGELTPSLKLKRRVVLEQYTRDIEAMYAE